MVVVMVVVENDVVVVVMVVVVAIVVVLVGVVVWLWSRLAAVCVSAACSTCVMSNLVCIGHVGWFEFVLVLAASSIAV